MHAEPLYLDTHFGSDLALVTQHPNIRFTMLRNADSANQKARKDSVYWPSREERMREWRKQFGGL